jgi:glycosyltransferase involved in cell wall biosynthesis
MRSTAISTPESAIPAFVPADQIAERFGLRGGDYLLCVGDPDDEGVSMLLRAFGRVDSTIRLVVAGRAGSIMVADPRVVVADDLGESTLRELFSNAALVVVPSHTEGSAQTIVRAASYNQPILATAITAHLEALGHPGPGRRVFLPGDEDALVAALRVVLRNLALDRVSAKRFGQIRRRAAGPVISPFGARRRSETAPLPVHHLI